MTKKSLVVFGTGDVAELAHYYFSRDSDYRVVAFTVDGAFKKADKFCDLSVIAFEEILQHFPPSETEVFIALAYAKLNQLRKDKYLAAKALGYRLASFVSSDATVYNDGKIGENCFIQEDTTIQPFVTIGNNVTLWSGTVIGHHATIHDHCFMAGHVVVSGGCEIGEQCFFGNSSTLRDHIKVGAKCVIGAGALLLSDAEAEGVYPGAATERSRVPSSRLRGI